jgi:CubicO group peptidase (beta-lactamase class C family)
MLHVATGVPTTVFWLAELSSIVVWMSLAMCKDSGAFEWDSDIDHVLDFPVRNPRFTDEPITFKQLALHQSSIRDSPCMMQTLEQLQRFRRQSPLDPIQPNSCPAELNSWKFGESCPKAAKLNDSPVNESAVSESLRDYVAAYLEREDSFSDRRPGDAMEYSSVGVSLAALIVERISGLSFRVFCQRYIFDPLGLTHMAFGRERLPQSAHVASGYLYMRNRSFDFNQCCDTSERTFFNGTETPKSTQFSNFTDPYGKTCDDYRKYQYCATGWDGRPVPAEGPGWPIGWGSLKEVSHGADEHCCTCGGGTTRDFEVPKQRDPDCMKSARNPLGQVHRSTCHLHRLYASVTWVGSCEAFGYLA